MIGHETDWADYINYGREGIATVLRDLADASPEALMEIAAAAWMCGWRDGYGKTRRSTRAQLAAELELPMRRVLHTAKIRAVYGAAFDMGAMHRRLDDERAKMVGGE